LPLYQIFLVRIRGFNRAFTTTRRLKRIYGSHRRPMSHSRRRRGDPLARGPLGRGHLRRDQKALGPPTTTSSLVTRDVRPQRVVEARRSASSLAVLTTLALRPRSGLLSPHRDRSQHRAPDRNDVPIDTQLRDEIARMARVRQRTCPGRWFLSLEPKPLLLQTSSPVWTDRRARNRLEPRSFAATAW
jgi:hypothetical protein